MPNTAIAFRESMTCIAAETRNAKGLDLTQHIFDALGATMIVDEPQIVPATALCACGIAVNFKIVSLLIDLVFCTCNSSCFTRWN
jgi:pyrroline-5-carboxylate reductase